MSGLTKKLLEGISMSAQLLDADEAGYLSIGETQAVQRFANEFAFLCRGLATEFLHIHPEAPMAKQAARESLHEIERATNTGALTVDERRLVDHFAIQLDNWIDKEATHAEWRRTVTRFTFRTPRFVRAWVLAITLSAIAISVGLAVPR